MSHRNILKQRSLAFLLLSSGLFLALGGPGDQPQPSSDFGLSETAKVAQLKQEEPEVIIGRVISSLLGFVGLIFFVLVVYAGGLWMTAAGNEEKVKKAKEILKAGVIGMAIVFSAYAITQFVISRVAQSTIQTNP